MSEFPVLIPTRAGLLGAVVATDDAPRAAAVILHGATSTRAGTNQVWAVVARSLADLGVVTLRVDYPGFGESFDADASRPEAVGEALDWFRARTRGLDLLIVGVCAGVVPGAELALRDPDVRGFAAMTPPLFPEHVAAAPPRASARRRLAHRTRRLPKRLYLRIRYGVRRRRPQPITSGSLASAADLIREVSTRTAVWVVTGEGDAMASTVHALADDLTASGDCRVEFVEGSLYSYPTPDAQDVQHHLALEWARWSLAEEFSA